jgi:hypothetical protein
MKIQTVFRFDEELLDLLKEKAKANKRSLNNYIEFVLYSNVGNIPNEVTKKAIKDADNNINMSNINDLEAYKKSLIDFE